MNLNKNVEYQLFYNRGRTGRERERESEREEIISMKISRDFFRNKIGRTK